MKTNDLVDLPHARSVADDLRREWALDAALQGFKPYYWNSNHEDLPVLHLEDLTGIPFLDGVAGILEYQHRARVRAESGDLFAAGTAPVDGYEAYCRDVLGLGNPDFIHAKGEDATAVCAACFKPEAFARLRRRSDEAGGLVIHPYMSIAATWQLAEKLTEDSGHQVSVLGPPPPVLWVANDKSRFSRLVEEVLGADWIVDTRRSSDPAILADALGSLAEKCERVGLKRTRCASAMGNAVFSADVLQRMSGEKRRDLIDKFLTRTRWCDDEDVLVVEWRETDISPSTQLWIPPEGDGDPVVEGVYEQLLEGPEKIFLGSAPSTLPEPLNQALSEASLQVGTALQRMGYIGRCSFDFIVTGDLDGDFHAQFTECNGRWGGTSTPMHLVDRLVPHNGDRPAYVATDYFLPESHRETAFSDLLAALDEELYSPESEDGRFILYNVGPLTEHGKFDVISLGEDPEDAQRGLDTILPKMLGI